MKGKIILIFLSISLLISFNQRIIGNEKNPYNLPKQQIEFNKIFKTYIKELNKLARAYFNKIKNSKIENEKLITLNQVIDINTKQFTIIKDINNYYNKKINYLLKDGNINNWIVKIIKSDFSNFSDESKLVIYLIDKEGNLLIGQNEESFFIMHILMNYIITRKHPLHKKLILYNKDDYLLISGNIQAIDIKKHQKTKKFISTKDWFYKNAGITKETNILGIENYLIFLAIYLKLESIKKLN